MASFDLPPHNKPLNLTGRWTRLERRPPRKLRVLSDVESAARVNLA